MNCYDLIVQAGTDSDWPIFGDIQEEYRCHQSALSVTTYLLLSLGRGTNETYGDISDLDFPLRDYSDAQLKLVSLGLGKEKGFKDVSKLNPMKHCIFDFRRKSDADIHSIPDLNEIFKALICKL